MPDSTSRIFETPAKGHEDDWGPEAAQIWGKAERVGNIQL